MKAACPIKLPQSPHLLVQDFTTQVPIRRVLVGVLAIGAVQATWVLVPTTTKPVPILPKVQHNHASVLACDKYIIWPG